MPTSKINRPWVAKREPFIRLGEAYYQTIEWRKLRDSFFGKVWNNKAKTYTKTQNLLCQICLPNPVEAVVCDHIIPRRENGKDTLENLQGLCLKCHKIKTDKDRVKYK